MNSTQLLRVFMGVVLPPLLVGQLEGLNRSFWICGFLTLLGFVPGILYALFVLHQNSMDSEENADATRITYPRAYISDII